MKSRMQLGRAKKVLMVLIPVLGLSTTFSANASFFSLENVVNGSTSFSVTQDGITMSLTSPQPIAFSNFPDGFDGLDLGNFPTLEFEVESFVVSFDQTVNVASFTSLTGFETVEFSIVGAGVNSLDNQVSCASVCTDEQVQNFNAFPLRFEAFENYLFSVDANGSAFTMGGIEASAVPLPGAIYLLGSAILVLAGVRKSKK